MYACPKRQDLSRNPSTALITDVELNDMMVRVETQRIGWVAGEPRMLFDHGVGLMHYFYGDGVSAARTLPYPGQVAPLFNPFPGGNRLKPALRANFRKPNGVDADPIHLNFDGYQYKIINETETYFFPWFRGLATGTFVSQGGANEGWTDGVSTGTTAIRVGDTGTRPCAGIVSFDTSTIPDGATVTGASLYLIRDALTGTNLFSTGAGGTPVVDVMRGAFGAPAGEPADLTAPADAPAAGYVVGSARSDGYAVRVELTGAALAAINDQGLTQVRLSFPGLNAGTTADYVAFRDGDAPLPTPAGKPTLADYMGSSKPFLDVSWSAPSAVAEGAPPPPTAVMRPNSPNPFGASTALRFGLARAGAARVELFDVQGRRVRARFDGSLDAGDHALTWDGRDDRGAPVAAGIYLARLSAGGASSVARVVRRR